MIEFTLQYKCILILKLSHANKEKKSKYHSFCSLFIIMSHYARVILNNVEYSKRVNDACIILIIMANTRNIYMYNGTL